VWVEAAPGSGKTTLAASWLDSRTRPCLWYQIDAGDADVATFFHYIGLAVRQATPRRKEPLPHLTAEYLASISVFARRFFEDAFRDLPHGTVFVFDNVQDAGGESALYDVLRIAIECAPAHVQVLCLSRAPPPPPLARLRLNGSLAVLEYDAVRLTLDEARAIALLRGTDDAAKVTAIHERTLGWTAGLVLMLEGPFGAAAVLVRYLPDRVRSEGRAAVSGGSIPAVPAGRRCGWRIRILGEHHRFLCL
jgi:ATP/maltotriose-dependent transcriptional regulator MalT